ncbi:MAG: hypothetical protein FJX23_03110, partial [Alphaproteobacteria bacterium]|nr:hypothetical protein [Alphaproteobacteria bacterium]
MANQKELKFEVPTQKDARLNPVHDKNSEWWNNIPGETPQKPNTEGWRQYDPSVQTKEYEFLLKDVLKVDELIGKVKGYEDNAKNFAKLKEFEGMATAMHDRSHQGDRDPVRMRIADD